MSFLQRWLAKSRRNEQGQALAEYGLILSLIALACMVALVALAEEIDSLFEGTGSIVEAMANAIAGL